ncbi:MAG: SWIM zinc finger family protein [Pseudomonadota bacterium]
MGRRRRYHSYFPPYVSVAERKEEAVQMAAKLKKKGEDINPVVIEGRSIATTFWGKAWCRNLEQYSDFENRLPRGRSYVRHGSVIDLKIDTGKVSGLVNGSSLYKVKITIKGVVDDKWKRLVDQCSGQIDSLIELLQGKFSKSVMELITQPELGLFPNPKEIKLSCSCPDYADMCKHVAAVLYGVGARLDSRPEDLFLLRKVNHMDLFATAEALEGVQDGAPEVSDDLSELFGIDLAESAVPKAKAKAKEKVEKKKITRRAKKPTLAEKRKAKKRTA